MGAVELDAVSVDLNEGTILQDVSFVAAPGELVGIVGPSGSGKTTVLRTVAGLVPLAHGRVLIDGQDVTAWPPSDRNTGMVFQEPALFPHRNVRRNVSFPLEVRKQHVEEIRRRVNAEVRALRIEELLLRTPSQLSKGEEQLVQIARAMVRSPGVLLLDEPFANLDATLKVRMRAEIGLLQRGYGVTTLMTTNDPSDAASLPDRLVVIEAGHVVQIGTWAEVHRGPVTLDAAMSTGVVSTIAVTVQADGGGFVLVAPGPDGFRLRAHTPALADRVGDQVLFGVRPEDVSIDPAGDVVARVERVVPGSPPTTWCTVAGATVWMLDDDTAAERGAEIRLALEHPLLFDPTSGYTIT